LEVVRDEPTPFALELALWAATVAAATAKSTAASTNTFATVLPNFFLLPKVPFRGAA